MRGPFLGIYRHALLSGKVIWGPACTNDVVWAATRAFSLIVMGRAAVFSAPVLLLIRQPHRLALAILVVQAGHPRIAG